MDQSCSRCGHAKGEHLLPLGVPEELQHEPWYSAPCFSHEAWEICTCEDYSSE
jgi:hypothetical protein